MVGQDQHRTAYAQTVCMVPLEEDGEYNAAIGYKATEYISLELHYDTRDEDSLGLRLIGTFSLKGNEGMNIKGLRWQEYLRWWAERSR